MDDPRKPTQHAPGSAEKVALLQKRASLRLPLFLEGDAEDNSLRPRQSSRSLSRQTAAKVEAVAEGLRIGKTYRRMASELGVCFTYITQLAKMARASPEGRCRSGSPLIVTS